MLIDQRSLVLLAGLALLAHGPLCVAAEPRAAFVLKDGWVELLLTRDGKPVSDAIIEIIDEQGKHFGDGETSAEGQAAFPLPRGASFVVEIKTGDRTADAIRLHKSDDGVEPAKVLLSYGLRPCCRFKERREAVSSETPTEPTVAPTPTEPATDWLVLAASIAGLATAAMMFCCLGWELVRCYVRRASSPAKQIPEE